MILRRMADAVREQNWFTVIIEILIVVIGIFLGLQVTDWNEGLKEQARADQYRERLIADITDDAAQFQLRTNFINEVLTYSEQLLEGLEGEKPESIDEPNTHDQPNALDEQWVILRAAFQASQIWPFEMVSIAYDEIQINGSISLIGNVDVINKLANYYSRDRTQLNAIAGTLPPYRTLVRGLLPWALLNDMWARCNQSDAYGVQHLKKCERPALPALFSQIPGALETLVQHPELPFLLRQRMSDARVRLVLYRDSHNRALKLINNWRPANDY